ncbi:MAG: MBL fold metallo-hydrolase, partial [Promethearchaeota archaeon]
HRYTGTKFNEGNISCIAMDWGLIFIDAGGRTDKAKDFRMKMEEKFKKPSRMMILTHTDGDHTQGMEAFEDLVIIVSEPGMQKALEEEKTGAFKIENRQKLIANIMSRAEEKNSPVSEEWKNDFAPRFIQSKLFVPHFSFKSQLSIRDNTQTLTLSLIQGHTPCSILIDYETHDDDPKHILFTGDNLNAEHADNSGCMLSRAMDSLEQIKYVIEVDTDTYVPGHGPVVNKNYAKQAYEYFVEMKSSLKQLKDQEVNVEEAIKHPSLPPFYEDKTPDFMPIVLKLWYENIV